MIEYEVELKQLPLYNDLEIVICPSSPFLYLFEKENYSLGSQDISEFEQGAYTGEITGNQLESMNVKYTLIGHSERRSIIKETQSTITSKIKRAYHSHIKPIYFIGETKIEKDSQKTELVLIDQLTKVIDEVPAYKREKMLVVYEPIWAIGTGETPTTEAIEKIISYIKIVLKTNYNLKIPVLYGGSVTHENIEELSKIEELDGIVIGSSSKSYRELQQIIKIVKNISESTK